MSYEDYLFHHGIKGQRWGVRRFQNPDGSLTTKGQERYRSKGYKINKQAILKENKISNDLKNVVVKYGSNLHGFDNRLKTIDSINRKLDLGKDIKDALRYTIVTDDNKFVNNYLNIKRDLNKLGYTETRCKNYFDMYNKGLVKHKSVQCNYTDEDGYEFEIQFHTPSSQKAKDLKVPLYEEARNPSTTLNRKKVLNKEMTKLAENVTTPKDINKIVSH